MRGFVSLYRSSAVAEMGDRLARHGPKSWGLLCPFSMAAAASPSNTMWPGPRLTSVPNFILIHPTVWPQHTNVTERQTHIHNGLIG